MPQAPSQATSVCRSTVKVANTCTVCESRSEGTATTISSLPMSRPAALGWTQARSSRLRLRCVGAEGIMYLLERDMRLVRQPGQYEIQLHQRGHPSENRCHQYVHR